MKIALPVTRDNKIDEHFGHCDSYGIYTVSEQNEITEVQAMRSEQGCGCKSGIASVLASQGVTVMLAGGIGVGAIHVLNHAGIEVVRGCSGDALETVRKYVEGKITDNGESCLHHEHHHGQHGHHGHHGHHQHSNAE